MVQRMLRHLRCQFLPQSSKYKSMLSVWLLLRRISSVSSNFSQGRKLASRIEVFFMAQHPSIESRAACQTDPRSAIKQNLLDHCVSYKFIKILCDYSVCYKNTDMSRSGPVTPYLILRDLFHLQITYCHKFPDSLHHVFMFLMGQEPSSCADVKFWKKLGGNT